MTQVELISCKRALLLDVNFEKNSYYHRGLNLKLTQFDPKDP